MLTELCAHCNGSGEGQYDGSVCRTCKGLGEVRVSDEDEPIGEYENEPQKPNKLHDWWDMNQEPVNQKFWICSYCSCCSRDDCGDGCKEKAARPCTHEKGAVRWGHNEVGF